MTDDDVLVEVSNDDLSPVFNHIVVIGSGDIRAEAVCTTGPYRVHGPYGRVAQRLTDRRITTVEEAQATADAVLEASMEQF